MSLKDKIRAISFFVIGRGPLINALTLLMLLGERASRETYPPFEPKLIYGHIGVLVICGVCMGFNMARKPAALMYSGQLLFMAYSIMVNEKLKYTEWVKVRMAHKIVGSAGVFLLYAFFNSPKPRNQQLRRIAEILIGLYLACHVYMLIESSEDKAAFVKLIPGGVNVLYVYAIFITLSALCYIPGLYVVDITQILVCMVLSFTIMIDCRVDYWTKKRGMDMWNQIRIIADSFCIVFGMLMFLSCTKKRTYDQPQEQQHEKDD